MARLNVAAYICTWQLCMFCVFMIVTDSFAFVSNFANLYMDFDAGRP